MHFSPNFSSTLHLCASNGILHWYSSLQALLIFSLIFFCHYLQPQFLGLFVYVHTLVFCVLRVSLVLILFLSVHLCQFLIVLFVPVERFFCQFNDNVSKRVELSIHELDSHKVFGLYNSTSSYGIIIRLFIKIFAMVFLLCSSWKVFTLTKFLLHNMGKLYFAVLMLLQFFSLSRLETSLLNYWI